MRKYISCFYRSMRPLCPLSYRRAQLSRTLINFTFISSHPIIRYFGKTSFLSGDGSKILPKKSAPGTKGGGKLLNTSSIARHLAQKGSATEKKLTAAKQDGPSGNADLRASGLLTSYTTSFLIALCRAYGAILARWGGGGNYDITGRGTVTESGAERDPENTSGVATSKSDPYVHSLLNVICFSSGIVRATWAIVQSDRRVISDLYSVIDSEKR